MLERTRSTEDDGTRSVRSRAKRVRLSGRNHYTATTRIAVTTALIVATGRSTFQPKRINWS